MSFWTYMLHCRGGCFYVGHTDDLDKRIGEHKSGLIPGFTADHQPFELVWADQFMDREDAKAAERKLKGWSRAKKLALIRGDWGRISELAKKKSSASTSSAWTDLGAEQPPPQKPALPELVEGLSLPLRPHRHAPPSQVRAVIARIWRSEQDDMLIEFAVEGSETLVLPAWASPERRDGLWQSTCFELFLMCPDGRYFEFNLSPSTEWALYAFDSYRTGMRRPTVDVPPHIEFSMSDNAFSLEADVDLGPVPNEQLSLSIA
ncbi:MAG: GIY-YIG nuclease family protein, partial [Novosphingobium sp.]